MSSFSLNRRKSGLLWASQMVLVVKNSPANAGDSRDVGSVLGLRRSLGAGNSNPLSILTWEIPRTEKPCRLQSMGLQRVRHKGTHNFSWAFDPSPLMYLFVLWSSTKFLQAGSASWCSWDSQAGFRVPLLTVPPVACIPRTRGGSPWSTKTIRRGNASG